MKENVITLADPETGLNVIYISKKYTDFPAIEWLIYFENTGEKDTHIIENVLSLDAKLTGHINTQTPFILHHTNGAPSNPTDFEMKEIVLREGNVVKMGGGGGRSSNRDFPFFRIDNRNGAVIIAVGWSGQWKSVISYNEAGSLHITAGLERTKFYLRPGEKVHEVLIHEDEARTSVELDDMFVVQPAEALWFGQTMLLAEKADMEKIADAIRKIQAHAGEIAKA